MSSASNDSDGRNVFLYDARDRNTVLGGLCLPQPPYEPPASVTQKTFFMMVDIIVFVGGDYTLENAEGAQIQRDEQVLEPGGYYIVTNDGVPISSNNEPVLARTISLGTGNSVQAFKSAVRERDGCCVVTRRPSLRGNFVGFQAAHIFPLAYEHHWNEYNFSRWISLQPETGGAINSVQNGLLMSSEIHQLFDAYFFSINPDDDYKIIWFREYGSYGHEEGALPRSILDDPRRPADDLLRWHFRQAVLANMKAAAEPVFEHDFPPGSDMLEDIRTGPKAAERMEAELFGRLALQRDISNLNIDDDNDSERGADS